MFCACSFHGNSMNNLLSYCGLIDAKIRTSDKDLTVTDIKCEWLVFASQSLLTIDIKIHKMFLFSSRYKWCKTITWENFDWNKKTSRTRLIVIMCSSAKNNNCNSCICLRCQRLVMANLVTSNSPVRIVPSSPEVSRGTVISS